MKLLKSNQVNTGRNGRKMQYDVLIEGTFLGTPLPPCREHNIIQRTYNKVLRDAIYPVDSRTLAYIQSQLSNPQHVQGDLRFYRRRLRECLKHYYTVEDNDGLKLIRPTVSAYTRKDLYFDGFKETPPKTNKKTPKG